MWAWFQCSLQLADAYSDHPQSAPEVQVSHAWLQGCIPQPVQTQWTPQENSQKGLEITVSILSGIVGVVNVLVSVLGRIVGVVSVLGRTVAFLA